MRELNFKPKTMKITPQEFDLFSDEHNMLSDMDYGRNQETGEYDVPALEWDGPYGKHWSYYDSEEDRQYALDQYEMGLEHWVKKHRITVQWEKEQKEKKIREIENSKTLGGMFPELEKLKMSL